MMSRIPSLGVVAVCLTLGVVPSAWAQGSTPKEGSKPAPKPATPEDPADPMVTARRPYTALFGGATVERVPSSGVRVNAAVHEVWDQNLLAEFSPEISSAAQLSGIYTNLVGDLTYARRTAPLQLGLNGGVDARYYTGLGKFAANDYHGGIGVSLRPTALTTVTANQSLSYAPVFLFGLFTDALPPALGGLQGPGAAYAVNDDRAVTTESGAEIERRLTPRATLRAAGAYRRSHYLTVTPRGTDFSTVDVGGDFRYRLTEDGDLRLGYAYRGASYQGAAGFGAGQQEPAEHILHVGGAFHPSLSDQRRTIVTFEGGTSFVNSAVSTNLFVTKRQIRLVGDVALAHQMGRSWLLVGAFKRGTGFVEGLSAPVFTDSVWATASGFVSSRTDLLMSLGYSNGEPSLVGSTTTFSTTTANARLRVALSARWAITAEYFFYHYDFSKVLPLSAGLDPRVKRNTLRAGLNLWLPVQR